MHAPADHVEKAVRVAQEVRVNLEAPKRTLGARCADWVKFGMGSWPFIIIQTAIIIYWMHSSGLPGLPDPYPFILLNLGLSLQAAYTGPMLLISQNRADAQASRIINAIERHTAATEVHTAAIQEHTQVMLENQIITHRLVRELHQLTTDTHADHKKALVMIGSLLGPGSIQSMEG